MYSWFSRFLFSNSENFIFLKVFDFSWTHSDPNVIFFLLVLFYREFRWSPIESSINFFSSKSYHGETLKQNLLLFCTLDHIRSLMPIEKLNRLILREMGLWGLLILQSFLQPHCFEIGHPFKFFFEACEWSEYLEIEKEIYVFYNGLLSCLWDPLTFLST